MRVVDGSVKNDEVERDQVLAESQSSIDIEMSVEESVSEVGNEEDNGGNEGTGKDISSDVPKEGKREKILETHCVTGKSTTLCNDITLHFLIYFYSYILRGIGGKH